jgi:hypothetical protein
MAKLYNLFVVHGVSMLWVKSWVIGLVISSVIAFAIFFPTPLGVVSGYLSAPLFPGFLLSQTFSTNGPPIGMRWIILASIAPILSGSLVYGFIVYLILRLRKELRKGNAI